VPHVIKTVKGFTCVVFVLVFFTVSCSESDSPLSPQSGIPPGESTVDLPAQWTSEKPPSERSLLAFKSVRIDPVDFTFEETDLRDAAVHMNVLNFLEVSLCQTCIGITKVKPGTGGTLLIDLRVTHPLSNPRFTGFDVRAVLMFDGTFVFPDKGFIIADRFLGDVELVNAHGYTTLYNPSTAGNGLEGYLDGRLATDEIPDNRLNPYIGIANDEVENTREAFYVNDEITLTCVFDLPDEPFNFAYAVDGCWEEPLNDPVYDPMTDFGPEANCPEAWKIETSLTPIGDGLTDFGGEALLSIDVYDHQGPDNNFMPVLECPDLFDGTIEAEWTADFDGFSRYEVVIQNLKLAQAGLYRCLISKEAAENDPDKFWLDLTAYQVDYIKVDHPFNPVDLTPEGLNIFAEDVKVNGNYAYVSDEYSGLRIYDISDKANPALISTVDLNDRHAGRLDYKDGYAYVCLYTEEIAIVDVDPPESAFLVDKIEVAKRAKDVSVGDGVLYAVLAYTYTDYLTVIDIDPIDKASVISNTAVENDPASIDSVGTTVVTVSEEEVEIWNASNPNHPIRVSMPADGVLSYNAEGYDCEILNGFLYVAFGDAGLHIFDISSPADSEWISSIERFAYGLGVDGDTLYFTATNGANGNLSVVDVTDTATPVVIGTFPGYTGLMTVSDGHAYFANHDFQIAEVEPAGSVNRVSIINSPYYIEQFKLSDGYCYAIGRYTGLEIFDIDPIENTSIVKSVPTASTNRDIAITDGYAYVTASQDGLFIIDIDPVETAEVISNLDIDYHVAGIEINGNFAYIGASRSLKILDISDPESPVEINELEILPYSYPPSVVYRDGLVYMLDTDGFFMIFDVTDPYSAFLVSDMMLSQTDDGDGVDIALDGDFAVVNVQEGLAFVDISSPEDPYLFEFYTFPEDPIHAGICASDGYVYLPGDPTLVLDARPPWLGNFVTGLDTVFSDLEILVDGNIVYASDRNGFSITQLW